MRTWTCSIAAKGRRPRPCFDGPYARAACSESTSSAQHNLPPLPVITREGRTFLPSPPIDLHCVGMVHPEATKSRGYSIPRAPPRIWRARELVREDRARAPPRIWRTRTLLFGAGAGKGSSFSSDWQGRQRCALSHPHPPPIRVPTSPRLMLASINYPSLDDQASPHCPTRPTATATRAVAVLSPPLIRGGCY